jgi:hypothetical protein
MLRPRWYRTHSQLIGSSAYLCGNEKRKLILQKVAPMKQANVIVLNSVSLSSLKAKEGPQQRDELIE